MLHLAEKVAFGGLLVSILFGCHNPDLTSVSDAGDNSSYSVRTSLKECKPPTPDNLIDLPIAPSDSRIDLYTPIFSNPTEVVNPLFPIKHLEQVVLVGFVEGIPFRAETTLLPRTQLIDNGDHVVETLVSQYVAYLDGRIDEGALDWYAQDDAGAVWYFGEDVFNYEDGELSDTEGTWLACKDGPAALIMPTDPQLGNVYRVENIYPLVFEEVEVVTVDQVVDGPLGSVKGAFTGQQLHLDASYAPKIFAPGYGEFSTGSDTDIEALAIAIPTDASHAATPTELRQILSGARRVFRYARVEDWEEATQAVEGMEEAWSRYETMPSPRLLKPLMAEAMENLSEAVAGANRAEASQSAIDVSKWGLDMLLQYESRVPVDFARLRVWLRQLSIDAEARDNEGVKSDLLILEWILARLENIKEGEANRGDLQAFTERLGRFQQAQRHQQYHVIHSEAERLLNSVKEEF